MRIAGALHYHLLTLRRFPEAPEYTPAHCEASEFGSLTPEQFTRACFFTESASAVSGLFSHPGPYDESALTIHPLHPFTTAEATTALSHLGFEPGLSELF